MDGTGGMVAVVQGLQDAGLAVTLLSQRYRSSGRSVLTGTVGKTCPNQACQTVADSATETVVRDGPKDTIYKSSYQLAHCQLSEFSPVRLPKYSLQGCQPYRSSISRSPDEEAFVGSLRKYPISPVRSRSADLIQRMLSYTQSKNGARYSSARSAKSLPSKDASKYFHSDEIPTRDTGIATNDIRPNYGYKRDVELVPVPMSSRKSRNENQIGMYDYLKGNKDKKLKAAEVRYLTNVKQCLRERLRQICDEEPATICPKIQHRYSQHRRQHHRTESSQKSPKVNYCRNMEKCTDFKDKLMQDAIENEIQISPSTSRERKDSQVNRSLTSFKHNKACFCSRPEPCDCGIQPSRSILKPSINKHNHCISICEYKCNEAKDFNMKQIKEIILNWSQELPVYVHFNTKDAMKKQQIIDELIDTLSQLQRDDTYFEKTEDEIRKRIKVLPMWRPDNKENQESFENQLALSLLQKLKSTIGEKNDLKEEILKWIERIPFTRESIDKARIADDLSNKLKSVALNRPITDKDYKEMLKAEVANTLNDLPIELYGSKTTVINNIADKLVEKIHVLPSDQPSLLQQSDIKNVILDWVKNIPQVSDLNGDDDVLVNDLITKLRCLQNTDTDNKQEQINDVVTNWLNFVEEKKKCRIDRTTKSMLTNQLVDKLVASTQMYRPGENINYAVQKWYNDMSDIVGLQFVDNQKELEMLVATLQDLQSIENDENRQNTMRLETLKWLQNLQRKQGRYVDSGTQENLVNKLITMIKSESHPQNIVPENGLITHNIWKWLESQPEFKQDNVMQYKDMVLDLSQKLQNLKEEKGEFTEYDVKEEVINWFEKLSRERGILIDPNNRKKLQDQLLSFISPIKRRKNWEKPNDIEEFLSKQVSDLINQAAIPLEAYDKKQLKDQIIKVISQDWKTIHSSRNDEPASKIMKILRQTTNLPESQITNLADTLIEKIKDSALSNLNETIREGPLILDNTLKNKLKNKVEYVLKTLPLKDKRQVIDTITDTIINNYEETEMNTRFEVIYEALKRANINEVEAREVANKILEMLNQFKKEITDGTHQSPNYGSAESLWVHKQMFMQRLEREITDFMEKVLNESSSFNKDTTSGGLFHSGALEDSVNRYDKFENSPLKTSTPTKSQNDRDIDIKSQCKNHIREIIRNWITNLKIDAIDESFKDNMAHDIATDIIDRHRYIQLSKTKRSSQDELEHLKYQIFKWTSKLPKQIDLTSKTDEIKMLLKSLEALEINNLIWEAKEVQDNANEIVDTGSLTGYSGNIITQNTAEFLEENIYGAIWNWLNEIPDLKPRSSQDRRIIDEIITDLSNKLKHILSLDENIHASSIENLCRDEIVHCLKRLNCHLESAEEQLEHRASDLMNGLKALEFFSNTLARNREICQDGASRLQKKDAIKKAVQVWCEKLPLKKGKTYDDMKDIVNNLAEAVSQYLLITDMENINLFMDDILSNLRQLPLQFDKEDSKLLPEFTEKLIETLKRVLNDSEKYYSNVQEFSAVRKPASKKAAQMMYDNIQNWCENLPLDLGTGEGVEQVNIIKQNLAGKLLKKIGELNLDPEIFQDDFLYEDVLQDEIQKILHDLPKSKQLEEALPILSKNLMKDLLEAKERMKNEIAGFAYKQLLRDAISKTLSSIGLSTSEETPLEILKDNLADAFINLHYVADHEEIKRKFKEKIFNEVNKFCNEYLKRNPSAQLNVHDLNQELYKALKNVPVPKDESMRREVEQIRVKDVVTDWFKDLPLEETPSHNQENKIITILAKRLHDIENEAEINPDLNIDETMNNEISKWLKKFKLKSENESSIELGKKNLINKLKATKRYRKLSDTTTRKSINYADLTSDLDNIPNYPPSNLSADDRAHLKRIKDRTSIERTILIPDDRKDASVSPSPIATGIQTEEKQHPDSYVFQKISQNESIQTFVRDSDPPTSITPQVIVKEYYWNTHGSPTMQRSGSILSCTHPPVALPQNGMQKINTISQDAQHVTTASQTKPLPVSKATITQEASIGQVIKTQVQNDSVGTSTQDSCLTRLTATQKQLSNEVNLEPQTRYYNPDDYLQLNAKNRAEIKSCRPCRERAVLPGESEGSPQAGSSKALQRMRSSEIGQTANERTNFNKCKPEFWSAGHINEDKNHMDDQNDLNQSCYRRLVCQTPTNDVECRSKRKKRSQQPCVCRSPLLTKCTIRPRSPCQHSHHSNKSCYVSEKHCPKCWDGFCPHPSYLYFRQD